MKKMLIIFACLACFSLNATPIGNCLIKNQNISTSQSQLTKGVGKGGGRGKKMGPSSKRRDPNQLSQGNKTGSEHQKNQHKSNEEKHQKGQARKNDQNKRAAEKNEKRHGKN